MMFVSLRHLLGVALICVIAPAASGDTRTIEISANRVESTVSSEGTYYVIEFDLPQNLASVRSAWLEVRLNVSATNDGPADPAPMLEVYMLKQAIVGDPDPSEFEATRLPMSRPVALGTNRLVKIDVTEFASAVFADPNKNHGIVIGSLTGARTGGFVVNGDGFGPGVPVRVTVIE